MPFSKRFGLPHFRHLGAHRPGDVQRRASGGPKIWPNTLLPQAQLRALGFRTDPPTGQHRCPGLTPFRDVLTRVEAAALQRALLLWQEQRRGPAPDPLVIMDGKTLRPAHVELVSAVNGQGRWLGTVPVPAGSNEIPAARQLLDQVPLSNKTALADAIHT